MKLCLLNGSPRKEKGNTAKILNSFLEGYSFEKQNTFEVYYLMEKWRWSYFLERINESDVVLIAFPLYISAMPGIVKEFLETLPDCFPKTVNIAFFVQSGFPESYQMSWMHGYFKNLAERLNYNYLGTIFQGFGASVEMMPVAFHKHILKNQLTMGNYFCRTGELDSQLAEKIRKPEKMSKINVMLYKCIIAFGLADIFTRIMLQQNHISAKESRSRPLESILPSH